MHMLLAEIWDLYFSTRHGNLSRQPRNIPSEILRQMLSSAEEKIVILDRSYCIENNGFRNMLILLLVTEGKFVRCSSVPAKWQTAQFNHIYRVLFIVFDR
jgi:hypothetical protein